MDLWSFYFNSLLVLLYSGRTTAYIEKVLENDSVCPMNFFTSNLNLIGREDQSAMVIKDSRYFQHWTGKHEFNCRFTVTSSLGFGIFAVIQHMSFRRNAQGQCIDYVQFRHTEKTLTFGEVNIKFKSSQQWGPKMCGTVNGFQVDVSDDELNNNNNDDTQLENSFIDMRGLIEVRLHLGNKSLDATEELSFEIVFTAFQECNFDNGLWKSCGSRTCIYKEFFQDGKLNCPYKSCKDEGSCRSVVTLNGNGDRFNTTFGTKIMAGTVAGLLTMSF
ncbi:Hypothetical protein CINCED_3A016455 [Cinara cedri]|uniref:Uncharacterized protein n=1 Tax=Cinara cedri TaxID=506608 RepID=A0A5E4NIF3_9HEMI|nr:Hypothetical protein CINCED_3A016455 [Cinara cedri]